MKFLTSILFLFVICVSATAQIEIGVSKTEVSIYENFSFSIRVYSGCEIMPAELKGFQIVGEPNVSQESYSSNINGKKTKRTATTYTYQIKSIQSGNYTLGPIKANCDGDIIQSTSIKVNVSETPNRNPDFYTELTCSKKEVYPGEAFILTLKVYLKTKSKTQLERIIPSELSYLQKIEVTQANDEGNVDNKYETVNGVDYNTAIIRQEVCFLSQSGNIVIEPYYTSALIGNGIFNTKRLEAYSNIIRIKGKNKPTTNLPNDIGLTGDFSLEYQLEESTLKVGEAIDYTITLSGNGNNQVFTAPALNVPSSFNEFEPELIENLQVNENGFFGDKSYHFTFVPTQPGDFTIPAYTIPYFNLKSKSYKQLSTKDMLIHIEEGDSSYGAIEHITETSTTPTELKPTHQITDKPFSVSDLLAGTWIHYTLSLLPFVLLVLILRFKQKTNSRTDEQIATVKKKKAKKGVKQYLEDCKKLHQAGNDGEAVRALSLAFKNYLKDKLNLTEHDLNLKNIHSHIENEGTKTKLTSCWNTIEMYQYSPVSANAVDDLIYQTESIINEIEEQL